MTVVALPLIGDHVRRWAALRPRAEALVMGADRRTWAGLAEDAERWARALLAAGVGRGDRVAVIGDPVPDVVTALVGVSDVGAALVGLNPRYPAAELAWLLADARPALLIDLDGGGAAPAALAALPDRGPTPRLVAPRDLPAFLASGEAVPASRVAAARAVVDPGDPAAVVYTSGSTGRPKGALLPHLGLVTCSAVQADRWNDRDGGRTVCNLPINHVGAIGDICTAALVSGTTIAFQPRFDPAGLLDLIAGERITLFGGVPAMLSLLVADPRWPTADLSSVDRVVWSGGAAPVELVRALATRIPRLSTSYGMTETVGSVTYSDEGAAVDVLAETIGRPDPRYELRIADEAGRPCPAGVAGELQVRGDHLTTGYLGRPDATAEAFADGWLRTGDLAVERPDGNWRLVGRRTEMFKSGGENVYPREVELALESHPTVASAVVVGVPDVLWGQVGHAIVVPAADGTPDPEAVRAHVATRLARFKVPKVVEVRAALPLLPVGKVDRAALAAELRTRPTG